LIPGASWGSTVDGLDEGDGWVKVQVKTIQAFRIYLPSGSQIGATLPCFYGNKSHRELFLQYGFADRYAPREASLHVDLSRRDPHFTLRQDLLLNLVAVRAFTVKSRAPVMASKDFTLLFTLLRIVVAPPAALEEKAAENKFAHRGTAEQEAAALQYLSQAVAPLAADSEETSATEAEATCRSFRAQIAEVFKGVLAFATGNITTQGVSGVVAASMQHLYAAQFGTDSDHLEL